MIRFFLICMVLLVYQSLQGVTPGVEWLNEDVDLGCIEENGGVHKAAYKFINTGTKSLKIKKVQVSCGCTEAAYPTGKINRGDTATIELTYDPEDRAGEFKRTTFVYFDKSELPDLLILKGNVLPSEETLKLLYPYSFGDLCFDSNRLDFGEVERGIRKRLIIDLYNKGNDPLQPVFTCESDAVRWVLQPDVIKPGGQAVLSLYLDSSRFIGFGKQLIELSCKLPEGREILFPIQVDIMPKP